MSYWQSMAAFMSKKKSNIKPMFKDTKKKKKQAQLDALHVHV